MRLVVLQQLGVVNHMLIMYMYIMLAIENNYAEILLSSNFTKIPAADRLLQPVC